MKEIGEGEGARKVLDGPGAEGDGRPGKRASGGSFKKKLARRCGEIVGEVGESELYVLLRDPGQVAPFF